MSRAKKVATLIVCILLAVAVAMGYALFHGYFDRGTFELLSSEKSPTGQLAMVAKRSDHEALNGDEVFVLLGDHIFSSIELRHALHSSAVVFSSDRDCLSLQWRNSHDLVISCKGGTIAKAEINRQLVEQGGVALTYLSIEAAR